MSKLRIYLAGPMTGYDNYNYDNFFKLDRILTNCGFDVVNPAQITIDMGGQDLYIANKDFANTVIDAQQAALVKCDAVLLMYGWENSVGSRAKLKTAINHNLKIFQQYDIIKLYEYDAITNNPYPMV